MVNHWFDRDQDQTLCGEYKGMFAWHVSANERVSCPDCFNLLKPEDREVQWYGQSE